MAGVTDLPTREMAMELGAGMAVGEMLSADLQLKDTLKTQKRQQHNKRAGLRSIQIVGFDPQQLAGAARLNAKLGADLIDINMGCPAKKICRRAAGSALLADTKLVRKILRAVVDAVSIPVTLKIRTGIDHKNRNGPEIARIAEEAGVQMLTVHGRTRLDRFKGKAEYDTIASIVDAVSLPVVANGDITSAEKARRVLNYTGAAGVMIGRAAQGQLWLPGAIAEALKTNKACTPAPPFDSQIMIHCRHVKTLHKFHGDYLGVRIARKHTIWLLETLVRQEALLFDNARALRSAFNKFNSASDQLGFLERLNLHLDLSKHRLVM